MKKTYLNIIKSENEEIEYEYENEEEINHNIELLSIVKEYIDIKKIINQLNIKVDDFYNMVKDYFFIQSQSKLQYFNIDSFDNSYLRKILKYTLKDINILNDIEKETIQIGYIDKVLNAYEINKIKTKFDLSDETLEKSFLQVVDDIRIYKKEYRLSYKEYIEDNLYL